MPDHTPPKYWDDRGRARKWLTNFISDTVDHESWRISDVESLCDEVFVVTRRGWKVMLILREPFRGNPDALIAFIEDYLAKNKKREQD